MLVVNENKNIFEIKNMDKKIEDDQNLQPKNCDCDFKTVE